MKEEQRQGSSSAIEIVLQDIRDKISRDTMLREFLNTRAEKIDTVEEFLGKTYIAPGRGREIMEEIFQAPTKIAQSDEIVIPKQEIEFYEKTAIIRNWLMDHGTVDEGRCVYEEQRSGGENHLEDKHFISCDIVPVLENRMSDKDENEGELIISGEGLVFEQRSSRRRAEMMVTFNFDGDYQLGINFLSERENIESRYHSGKRPIAEMTGTDAVVILTIFDDFIGSRQISDNS